MSGDTFFIAARVCFGTKQTIGQTVLKSITGHSRHQMTSGPYRTLLSTFFIPPHRLSSVLSAYLIPKQGADEEGGSGWQLSIEDTNIQGQPPTQCLVKLYLHHHHIASNPSTSASESETGFKPRGWSTLRKFKTTHKDGWPISRFCAQHSRDVSLRGHYLSTVHITWHKARPRHHSHHSIDFSDVESSAVLSSSLICCSGGSEAVVAFSGYLLRLSHSESCRTLAALLEQRDSGVGRWEADIWHAMRLVLCSQASFWRPTALAAVEN